MGFIGWIVSQTFITSVALGALKRKGVIEVNSRSITNESVRFAFDTAVNTGEQVARVTEGILMAVQAQVRCQRSALDWLGKGEMKDILTSRQCKAADPSFLRRCFITMVDGTGAKQYSRCLKRSRLYAAVCICDLIS
ncbi:hypothetical protein BSKO_07984 [Bryopsis sp. KO-2023]|nr:hypothetical protein BSKO_07984 [Bryopsis sp. KO-2023]